MVKGSTPATYTSVRPATVLSRSIVSSILYWEMKRPSTGIIWMTSRVTMNDIRPRKRNRETATAATKAKSSATTMVRPVTIRLTLSALRNWSPAKTVRKLSRSPPKGTQVGTGLRISLRSRNELLTIQ